jgi:response regulator RpfG family c-di-GMP phosphodiesterase
MPEWAVWSAIGLVAWMALAIVVSVLFGRVAAVMSRGERSSLERRFGAAAALIDAAPTWDIGSSSRPGRRKILLVDDDPSLRLLLRTTLAAEEYAVEEASTAEEAAHLARFWRPSLVILDVGLPDINGVAFCAELKRMSAFGSPAVIILTGGDTSTDEAREAGADALLRKPFSPLELVTTIDRIGEGQPILPATAQSASPDQLLAYARDLGRIVEAERAQRRLLQQAYRQTVAALTDALEARNEATGLHSVRVHRFALELTEALDPSLLDDPSLEYGFLLHDIGKIAIPDAILEKRGPLTPGERRLVERHPLIGVEILSEIPLLEHAGTEVVRSHHERWDGQGYPQGLGGDAIPLGARIFAVADALDAMTTDRPYRQRLAWDEAVDEILRESGHQFDPQVVRAFALREQGLRRSRRNLAQTARLSPTAAGAV